MSSQEAAGPEIMMISEPRYFHVDRLICGRDITFLVDSGSALDCLDKDTYYSLLNAPKLKQSAHSTVYGIDETQTMCYRLFHTNISITHNGVT